MSLELDTEIVNEEKDDCRDLESQLRKYYSDELIVLSYSIDNLIPFGENFRSSILKVNAQVQRTKDSPVETLHFVAKTVPIVVMDMVKNIDWNKLFKKEIFMYVTIIPFYQNIELENGIDNTQTIASIVPKLCGYRLFDPENDKENKDSVILLENLKIQGYYFIDKKIGLDMQHSTEAVKALAKFHALGITAKTNYPDDFDSIKSSYPQPDYDYVAVDSMCLKFIEALKADPYLKRYATPVERIAERQRGGWKSELVTHDLWSTIIHYDFWTNNIAFLRCGEEGNAGDVCAKMLDFQTYCFADVFLDLVYFLGTSLDDAVKLHHVDELLDVYYETFVEVLEAMRVDVAEYSSQKFRNRLGKVAAYELLHCALVLKFITADIHDDRADRESVLASLMTFGENELYSKRIMQLLQLFEARDWFN